MAGHPSQEIGTPCCMQQAVQDTSPGIRVLGTIAIRQRESGPFEPVDGSTATLLCALVAAGQRGIDVEELSELFWGHQTPQHWRRSLHLCCRWLQDRLPAGWHVSRVGGRVELVAGTGSVDAWQVLLATDGQAVSPERLGAPYPGVRQRGVIEASAIRIRDHQNRLRPDATEQTRALRRLRACPHHEIPVASLVELLHKHPATFTDQGRDRQRHTALRTEMMAASAESDPAVYGGTGPDVDFGDLAIALREIRWDLLAVEADCDRTRSRRAWRIVRDHLSSATGGRRLFVYDAHLLDPASLDLLAHLTVRATEVRWSIFADAEDPRPQWQRLRQQLEDASDTVERCSTCLHWSARAREFDRSIEMTG